MQRFADWFRDSEGRGYPGAQVTVYESGTSNKPQLYNAGGSISSPAPISNPTFTDSNGYFAFAVPNGTYDIHLQGGGMPDTIIPNVSIGTTDVTAIDASDITYDPGLTGSVVTTQQRKNEEHISLFDFMTAAEIADVQAYTYLLDVSAAVQAAFDACKGRWIYAPAGGYLMESTANYVNQSGIAQPYGLIMVGDGPRRTIFRNRVASGPCFNIDTSVGATALSYFFSYGGMLAGFWIDGDAGTADSDGMRISGCWDYILDRLTITDHTRYGIHIYGDSGINADYTASANMRLSQCRISSNKIGIYQPYGNSWPLAIVSQCYITSNTDAGMIVNSAQIKVEQCGISYNGRTGYTAGTGNPDPAYGGIVFKSANGYQAKGTTFEGCEFDDNYPQNIYVSNAIGIMVRNCNIISRLTSGYINKYSVVFGESTQVGSTYCDNPKLIGCNMQLPVSLASSGKTHTFALYEKFVRWGEMGQQTYSIAGGTIGTEIFWIEEKAKNSGFTSGVYRTKFTSQNGSQVASSYVTQFGFPESRRSMADDTAISFTPVSSDGVILVAASALATRTAMIGYSVTNGRTFIITSGATDVAISGTSLVLNGTTGTDGKLTVTVDATSGKIYIENRVGGTVLLTHQTIDGFGNWL